jgi:hypothetical protein
LRIKILLSLILIIVLVPLVALAGISDSHYSSNDLNAAVGVRTWFTQADAKWQISFPYITSGGQPGRIESELKFENIDSPMIVMTGGGMIAPQFSFDVLLGFGSISGGRGTDIDRFISSTGGGLEFSRSQSDLSGDVRMWGGNVYFNNAPRSAEIRSGGWGAVFGILHYEDNLTLRNGVQTNSVSFEGMYMPPGPFTGLNSTFDFSWNMLKVGVLNRAQATKKVSFLSQLAVYPYVDYRGEAYWNLRAGTGASDFRVQSPNFIQESTKGHGYEGSLELIYAPAENVELSAGYRYFYLRAEDGTDRVYFADGSVAESTLDWVTVTRHGAYAEFTVRF